ncbi:MAG: O-antigen ligase family protein [Acidobacteria bacterium]|nr:O-antigen ligase family protein [Acidobacteriota bacterium]
MRIRNGNGTPTGVAARPAPIKQFPKREEADAFEFSAPPIPSFRPGTHLFYLAGLIAAVAVAVIFFGGTETFSWAAAQILLLAIGVVLLLEQLRQQDSPSRTWVVPAALLAWVVVQWRVPIDLLASQDRWATGELFVRLLVYGSAFAAARRISREEKAAQRLVLALLILGVFEAAYGLAQYLTGWQKILWQERVYYRESATGTYVNHNHFAGFLEMVIPFAVAQALGALPRKKDRRSHAPAGKAALFLFLAAVLVLAVIFSQSRMGLIACVGSLAAMATVLRLRGRDAAAPSRALRAGLILLLLAASAALMFWIGPEPVFTRFAKLPEQERLSSGVAAGGRLAVWADTLRLIRERPLGVGLGAFEAAYTKVQTVDVNARVDYAHNDYLQVAAELGPVAALLFWAMIFALAARALRACWTAASPTRQCIAQGATGALAALLLHSLTDFNLYIPANGLVFSVVLGLSSAQEKE